MTFITILSTIESDVKKGFEVAAPFLKACVVVPTVGPILSEIGTIITNLEQGGHEVDTNTLSAIVQAVALVVAAKNVPAAQVSTTTA